MAAIEITGALRDLVDAQFVGGALLMNPNRFQVLLPLSASMPAEAHKAPSVAIQPLPTGDGSNTTTHRFQLPRQR